LVLGDHPRMRLLLSARAHRWSAGVLAGCAIFTGVAGYLCSVDTGEDFADGPVDSWVIQNFGSHAHALQLAADLGQGPQVVIMTLVLVVACVATRSVNSALLALVSIPAAAALTEVVLKPLVNQHYSSFPSGRSTGIFAVITVVTVLLAGTPADRIPRPARRIVTAVVYLLGFAVAAATVGLGYHTATDVAGGAAVGTGVVLAVALVLDLPVSRRLLPVAAWRGASVLDTVHSPGLTRSEPKETPR
jgi:membrane-associated phospholipid phosphatase